MFSLRNKKKYQTLSYLELWQSDQGLLWLLFHPHPLNTLLQCKHVLFLGNLWGNYIKCLSFLNFKDSKQVKPGLMRVNSSLCHMSKDQDQHAYFHSL